MFPVSGGGRGRFGNYRDDDSGLGHVRDDRTDIRTDKGEQAGRATPRTAAGNWVEQPQPASDIPAPDDE